MIVILILMTTVQTHVLATVYSGFPPQTSLLLQNASTKAIFTSIIILMKVYPVLVLIFGSVGNLLSFCVLLRANMRRYSTFCYLACLALVDLGVIITFCWNFISMYHFNNDIQNGPFACKLFAFFIYFLPQYSSWILVAVSIDRVISAKYLRLAKTWSKPRHSVLVTLLLGLFLGILNSHFFLYENHSIKQQQHDYHQRTFSSNQTELERYLSVDSFASHPTDAASLDFLRNLSPMGTVSGSAYPFETYTRASAFQRETTLQQQQQQTFDNSLMTTKIEPLNFDVNMIHCSLESSPEHASLHLYWVWIDLLVNVFLPFTGLTRRNFLESNRFLCFFVLAMIACTIIIILTLVRSSTRAGSTSVRRSRRRRNISVMLITVNLVFISLTAPIVIFLSIYPYVRDESNYYRQTILILIKISCIILMNLNHSVNIIIYSLTAKEFRSEMVNFFRAMLYCLIGPPLNSNELAFLANDDRCWSRFQRCRSNFFQCCRTKFNSDSSNTTDSSGLQQTRASNMTIAFGHKFKKRKRNEQNGKRKSSVVRYSETSTTFRTSHRLTVQIQNELPSNNVDRENLSLHRLSYSTEDC